MFEESEEGVLPRKKIRVRWYNDQKERLSLEEKTSSIEGRFKKTTSISKEKYEQYVKNGILNNVYGKYFHL